MPQRTVTVASKVGLHARPAAVFVKKASELPVPVTLAKDGGKPVNAKSMLAVMSLDVRGGERVTLAADGEGAAAAVDELAELLETNLDG
ncbi:Phosphotransferase system, phosphocarrier protein HPr [Catenulispora acidiphila DSM 44928]|uniref:Phosphocarrier protein HPr n=1 Tax=Catenulispora acidiphila (strain DSM 44928 / JCM 14897 / NBRC 102108 / NRRL B-24433 / ID139908) TaxID=479433 RepID=C7QIN8_CATAD|nr:HPr family phosphocarrier protein [Catenulispora acidiphila]ACU76938.1 Phosphotransferase system, phosphocarrier protein HPr [Catenulispora acidiphila DSM 44928]